MSNEGKVGSHAPMETNCLVESKPFNSKHLAFRDFSFRALFTIDLFLLAIIVLAF